MSCGRYTARIDALFVGEKPSARRWDALMDHVKTCERCARYYNRAVVALRQMSGGAGEVCAEELNPIGEVIARRHQRETRAPWWVRGVGMVGTLAVAAIATWILVPSAASLDPAGEVRARGAAAPMTASVRAFCVEQAAGGELVVVGASTPEGQLACSQRQLLQFAYSLRADRPAFLYLAGIDAGGGVLEYYPRPPETRSIGIAPAPREEALPGSVRLGVKHAAGVVSVVGVITSQPVDRQQAMQWIQAAAAGGDLGENGVELVRLRLDVLP